MAVPKMAKNGFTQIFQSKTTISLIILGQKIIQLIKKRKKDVVLSVLLGDFT